MIQMGLEHHKTTTTTTTTIATNKQTNKKTLNQLTYAPKCSDTESTTREPTWVGPRPSEHVIYLCSLIFL